MSTPLLVVVGQNSPHCPMVGSVLTSPVSSQHSEALLTAKKQKVMVFFQPCKIGLLELFSQPAILICSCVGRRLVQIAAPHMGWPHSSFHSIDFLPPTQSNSHANEDDDDGNPKCMGSFDVTGLARRQKMVGGSQHK